MAPSQLSMGTFKFPADKLSPAQGAQASPTHYVAAASLAISRHGGSMSLSCIHALHIQACCHSSCPWGDKFPADKLSPPQEAPNTLLCGRLSSCKPQQAEGACPSGMTTYYTYRRAAIPAVHGKINFLLTSSVRPRAHRLRQHSM